MNDETIKKILDLAVRAPSGDNVQPWRFEMKGGRLFVYDIPERDNSLYNFRSLAAQMNHGALLENINIIAPSFGYRASIEFFPRKDDPLFISSVTFEKAETKEHPLFSAIARRHANRKPYDPAPLSQKDVAELRSVSLGEGESGVFFATDENQKKRIGKAASKNEVVLFENPKLHSFFYRHIHWAPETGDETGFPVETLEIPKEAFPMFRALRSWNTSRVLSFLQVPSLIAAQNAKLYASAGAHGAIVFSDFSPRASVLSGMLFERLWLQTTKMGLKFQPLMGVTFLMERIRAGDDALSERHKKVIKTAYHEMERSFGISNGVMTAAFRVGRGGEPSGKTKRLPPDVKFL